MKAYYALTFPQGFKALVHHELKEKIPDICIEETLNGRRHGVLFARSQAPVQSILDLACLENAFLMAARIKNISYTATGATRKFETIWAKISWPKILAQYQELTNKTLNQPVSFHPTVLLQGPQEYTVHSLTQLFVASLESRGWQLRSEKKSLTVRMQILNKEGFIGIQLTSSTLKNRVYKKSTLAGSLDPSVAYLLCKQSYPKSQEIVLDPCCGAGTLIAERSQHWPAGLVIGGEIQNLVLKACTHNMSTLKEFKPSLYQGDARYLAFKSDSIHKIIVNLPFGKDISLKDPHLFYHLVLNEFKRVLKKMGTMVLLSGHPHLIKKYCDKQPGLKIQKQISFVQKGIEISSFTLIKL